MVFIGFPLVFHWFLLVFHGFLLTTHYVTPLILPVLSFPIPQEDHLHRPDGQ